MSQSLASQGLSAQRALDCCRAAQRRTTQLELGVRSTVGEMLRLISQDRAAASGAGAGLALVPALAPKTPLEVTFPRVIRIAPGAPLAAGTVVLIGANRLIGIARQTAAIEALEGALKAIDTSTKTQTDDCEKCIKKALWKQTKPQKRVIIKGRPRLERKVADKLVGGGAGGGVFVDKDGKLVEVKLPPP